LRSAREFLRQLMPALDWRARISRRSLRADLLAGLVGAVVVVPQGIAFATLAGLPPQYGLYSAMVPAVVAALFGSSWHLVSGPTNAISLVVFATLAPLAEPGSVQYVGLALKLALLVGLIQLAMGLARLGVLVNFVSHTVVVGFTAGAGILIIAAQLGNFFGLHLPRSDSLPHTLLGFARSLGEARPWVCAVALITLGSAVAARFWLPRVPNMLVALVAGGAAGYALNRWLGSDATGLVTLGALPGALPPLSVPEFSLDTFRKLTGVALAVALLGLAEAVSIARSIAVRSGQRIDANREFVGQGLSNLIGSFFSAYPSSGSFNRSGLNYDAGAQTPLAAVLSAPLLLVLLAAIAPLLSHLPLAAMAGILFMVAWNLIDLAAIRHIARTSRGETVVLAVTFAATLLAELEFAILFGVALSLVLYLRRTSQPAVREVGPDPSDTARKFGPLVPGRPQCPQLGMLRVEGSLYFGAVNHVAAALEAARAANPQQKHLLILAKSINFVDVSGTELLHAENRRRRAAGGELYFHGLRPDAEEALQRSGVLAAPGGATVFVRKRDAIGHIFARLDPEICARCRARIFEECATRPLREEA
jgi:SulP family sulfate permease